MIARLRGRVVDRSTDWVILDVGGVGYLLTCPSAVIAGLPSDAEVLLHTHTFVRETALVLYGFDSRDTCEVFERLLGASGVGPKLAISLLSAYTPDQLRQIVATEDASALRSVGGVGAKGAARLVLELRGKLGEPLYPADAVLSPVGVFGELAVTLSALGYEAHEVASAIAALPDASQDLDIAALVRLSVRHLRPPLAAESA